LRHPLVTTCPTLTPPPPKKTHPGSPPDEDYADIAYDGPFILDTRWGGVSFTFYATPEPPNLEKQREIQSRAIAEVQAGKEHDRHRGRLSYYNWDPGPPREHEKHQQELDQQPQLKQTPGPQDAAQAQDAGTNTDTLTHQEPRMPARGDTSRTRASHTHTHRALGTWQSSTYTR